MRSLRPVFLAKTRGQSLVIAALVLPVLLAFTLLVVEVAERWLEVAMVEDALQHATRSAVQTIDYAPLAEGQDRLRASAAYEGVTTAQAAGGPCADVIAVADTFFRVNLRGVRGLVGDTTDTAIAAAAAQVVWTVYPAGGSCTYSNGEGVAYDPTPLICAEVRPTMRGIVGWGHYTPLIVAADRLDPVQLQP
jgi:Flp pilus assembly protein TadG